MPILKCQLILRLISSGGRNLLIDFNLLPILPAMATVFYAICKKSSGHYRFTCCLISQFLPTTLFYDFILLRIKKASPQNIVLTHTSNIPHMVIFL